jgi:hypothetical protein
LLGRSTKAHHEASVQSREYVPSNGKANTPTAVRPALWVGIDCSTPQNAMPLWADLGLPQLTPVAHLHHVLLTTNEQHIKVFENASNARGSPAMAASIMAEERRAICTNTARMALAQLASIEYHQLH